MDAIKLLKRDHKELKSILKKLEKTSEKSQKAREQGFKQLMRELSMHAEVEEKVFYPRVQEEEKLRETANEAYEEHHLAKVLLNELSNLSPDDERWTAKLSVLKEITEHHIEEEEGEMFPKVARILGKAQSEELGEKMEMAKKEQLKAFKAGPVDVAPRERLSARSRD